MLLQKNLEQISRYNPALTEQILAINSLTNSINLIETDLKEPNLVFNGLAVHSQEGAEAEATRIFSSASNTPISMHVVFGFGLGYLFKEFCENSKGRVIVYEPNLEILRTVLEIVDFSKELSKPNVFITSDLETFSHIFKSVYNYKADCSFSSLPTYRHIYKESFEAIVKQAEITAGVCVVDYNSLKDKTNQSIDMLLENLPYLLEATPLNEYRGIYKGKTALIVSAGPSLDLNLKTIKDNRDKFVIFCVGTALRTLLNNNIKPDILAMVELNDCSSQIEGLDLSNIDLILEPYTHNVFHRAKTKNKLTFATETAHINQAWAKLFGVGISHYKSRGTVSYLALFSAQLLGCEKIVLIGQDLAYTQGRCYSAQSKYADLICELNPETNKVEVTVKDLEAYGRSLTPADCDFTVESYLLNAKYHLEQINKTLYYVKGVDGSMLPTQAGYATFIEHFKAFALEFPNLELINSSMIGAQIDGFKNIALEDVVKKLNPIETLPVLSYKNIYDNSKIKSNLDREEEILSAILAKIIEGKGAIEKFEREFGRRKMVNESAGKAFKQLLTAYNEIVTKDLPNSLFFSAIALVEDLEVQYNLKIHTQLSEQGFIDIFSAIKPYFINVEVKLSDFLQKIKQLKF